MFLSKTCSCYFYSSFSSEEEDDDWCPPLPARTYLMDSSREELSSLRSKPDELSYAATLMSSIQRDAHNPRDSPRLQPSDLFACHHSQISQSDPDLFTNTKGRDGSEGTHTNQWADHFKGESLCKGQFEFTLKPHILESGFPGAGAQPHSVMYNSVSDVKEFVHENHVAFCQCSLASSGFPAE